MFFRIVATTTLTGLRRDADLLAGYRQRENETLAQIDTLKARLAEAETTTERLRAENESLAQLADPDRVREGRWDCVCQIPPHTGITLCADPHQVAAVIGEYFGDAAANVRDKAAAACLRDMLRAHFAQSPAEPGVPYYAVALVVGGVLDDPTAPAPAAVPAGPTREQLRQQIGEVSLYVATGERGPEERESLRALLRAYFAAAPGPINPNDPVLKVAVVAGGVVDTSALPYLLLA
ncbi:hypothetical protein [Kitasatospora kifunensis]|uniref:Uncharacterized protein n=1 Tax=Kitasatospora kifunensis TaxID=58351 RepID=A0A7W7W100_KITKI|nr:hypothetical protein [Kitasatospora kifunensis]MBB4929175.1 hypothetical protein [Kitasatospora kifunensis]